MCRNLAPLKNNPTFSDVTVSVEGTDFFCHRLVLAAASEYFDGAFTSSTNKKLNLREITRQTFSTVLDCIYSNSCCNLSEQNIGDVINAAKLLQMPLLLKHCKTLVINTLSPSNCIQYLSKVRDAIPDLKEPVLKVVIENFTKDEIRVSLHHLGVEEMKAVVASDKLAVSSEDQVVGSVLSWAENKPLQQLGQVLASTRYMLISPMYFHCTLVEHPLVKGDPKCYDIVIDVPLYQSQPHLHQTWCPPSAKHRDRSDMINVLLIWDKGTRTRVPGHNQSQLCACDPKSLQKISLACPDNLNQILCHSGKLYHVSSDGSMEFMCLSDTAQQQWQHVGSALTNVTLAIGEDLYTWNKNEDSRKIKIFKLANFKLACEQGDIRWSHIGSFKMADRNTLQLVTSIGSALLLFYRNDMNNNYIIQSFDTTNGDTMATYMMINPSSNLITVRYRNEVIVIQENGSLWRIQQGNHAKEIKGTHELTLWNEEIPLTGAALYDGQLYIVGAFPDLTQVINQPLTGVFKSVKKVSIKTEKTPLVRSKVGNTSMDLVRNTQAGETAIALAVIPRHFWNGAHQASGRPFFSISNH